MIHNFNISGLTESMMQMAETFLVKCLEPTIDLETFDVVCLTAFNGNALKMDLREPHSPHRGGSRFQEGRHTKVEERKMRELMIFMAYLINVRSNV